MPKTEAYTKPTERQRSKRTWPLLAASFGALILLISLSGMALRRHAQQIQREVMETQRAYLEHNRVLEELRFQTLSLAIELRDYLLDDAQEASDLQQKHLLDRRKKLLIALDGVDRLPANDAAGSGRNAPADRFLLGFRGRCVALDCQGQKRKMGGVCQRASAAFARGGSGSGRPARARRIWPSWTSGRIRFGKPWKMCKLTSAACWRWCWCWAWRSLE